MGREFSVYLFSEELLSAFLDSFFLVAKSCSKSKRGQYESTAPLSFSARASPVRQTVLRRTALG